LKIAAGFSDDGHRWATRIQLNDASLGKFLSHFFLLFISQFSLAERAGRVNLARALVDTLKASMQV
jgi:hypothetical protein